ncbi:MAG TPA: phospholipase D-like domain-containing protein [Polyangiaceae bacterium]|nr:phospholipase D-like domain-containing protein [Polyangiaceae bacterium]
MATDVIPRRFRQAAQPFVGNNRVELLRDGVEAYPRMLAAIEAAREQCLLEMYWFDSDHAGRRFADALGAAARRGVEVAVIYDDIGSIGTDPLMFEELKAAGAHVRVFNPVAPWRRRFRLDRLTLRDHRKILVVDGEVGFTGGCNLAAAWLPIDDGGRGWRDDAVRVEGPAVRGLTSSVLRTWHALGGPTLRRIRPSIPPSGTSGAQAVRVLAESYFRARREISRAYVRELYHAKERAWIRNAYFIPDRSVRRALGHAARRGVDVRVIMPGETDVELVRHASRSNWGYLLRHGVRLFEYQEGVLHAKSAVIDGRWSTIGTFNLDYLSLRSNLEINVSVRDPGFGATMEASFIRDLDQSREIDRTAFRFRPLGDRLLELLVYRFRKLL